VNAPTRLGLYGVGLAAVFGAAFATAAVVVPESTVANWSERARSHDMDASHETDASDDSTADDAPAPVRGLSLEQDGFTLGEVTAPPTVGSAGTLSFTVVDADGRPTTRFDESHTKQLHLIVVRSDGSQFRHVHPTMTDDGEWSLPWEWAAAGTYRVYADFVPSSTGENVTLSRTFEVAGDVVPDRPSVASTTSEVAGFEVTLSGTLSTTDHSELTATVTRDGRPVRSLQPYLGAFGHLVALREGDLAYLHVHPEGDEPAPGDTSGPDVTFMTTAPTPGRYLLYLDVKIDGQVHTAEFVVDAGTGTSPGTAHGTGHGS